MLFRLWRNATFQIKDLKRGTVQAVRRAGKRCKSSAEKIAQRAFSTVWLRLKRRGFCMPVEIMMKKWLGDA